MIIFAWWGLPQYAARCIGAFVKATNEKVVVLATRPAVPIRGMEELCGCEVKWIGEKRGLGTGDWGLEVGEIKTLIVSGWAIPAFNELARQVKAQGGRVICMVDNNFRFSLDEVLKSIRFRLFLRRWYDGFFVPGKSGRRLLKFYGVPDEKIAEGLYSADEILFHDGKPLVEREKKIIYVGQFIERKNVKRMCKAFIRANVRRDWTLELYGSGPLREELNRTIEQSNNRTIILHDFLQPEELTAKYREARVFCLPSVEEHWGLVVHEAALSGCALLLSNRVGAAEDLLDANGLVINPDNEGGMSEAFAKLMSMDEVEWLLMQNRSVQLAERRGLVTFVTGLNELI